MVYLTTFQVICLKCGSQDIEVNDIGECKQFVCLKCGNYEDENQ